MVRPGRRHRAAGHHGLAAHHPLSPTWPLTLPSTVTFVDEAQPGHTFAEWGYLGKGKFQRRDFRFDVLTGSSAFSAEGSLFADLGKHEIFAPVKTHSPMTVHELAAKYSTL